MYIVACILALVCLSVWSYSTKLRLVIKLILFVCMGTTIQEMGNNCVSESTVCARVLHDIV